MADNGSGVMKAMRKGTRSCKECRRRKIRCIYPHNDVTCHECTTHKRRCLSQGYLRSSTKVEDNGNRRKATISIRVSKLESVIERLSTSQNQLRGTQPTGSVPKQNTVAPESSRGHIEDLDELDRRMKMESPIFRLFQNQVVSTVWRGQLLVQILIGPDHKR